MRTLAAVLLLAGSAAAADETPASTNLHFQATVATQAHPTFPAAYSGQNSMQTDAESASSIVTDLYAGVRLWPGGEFYFQPELSGGTGLSLTTGVAAFPSGEVYRIGNPKPAILPARVFYRQTIGLGGGTIHLDDGPNQLAGTRDRDALTVTVGKVATPDFFDNVPVANDPHTQFMSWGIWASAAYDYPADTRGYTWGIAADLSVDWWSLRAGMFLEPQYANLLPMEWDIRKARGIVGEAEARFTVAGRKVAARVLGFLNTARMGSYRQVLSDPSLNMDVAATREEGRKKGGFAASANAELGGGLAAFARASWDDGANENWAFTEIDRSFALGATQSGARWGRENDQAGAALVVSGLSNLHKRYLEAGGHGFLIGDGALHYGSEVLGEIFYRAALSKEVSLSAHYQPIVNPAYNQDRGPIHVFTGRLHVGF
jgi:high affinity Mn2+ porin